MWIVCLADDAHKISSLIFSDKSESKNIKMSSAADMYFNPFMPNVP